MSEHFVSVASAKMALYKYSSFPFLYNKKMNKPTVVVHGVDVGSFLNQLLYDGHQTVSRCYV